jgi:hypothetical protein
MRLRWFTAISTVLTIVSLFFVLPSPREQRLYQQITRQTAVCPQISDVLQLGRDTKRTLIACIKTMPVQQSTALYGVMGGLGLFVLWCSRRRRKTDET